MAAAFFAATLTSGNFVALEEIFNIATHLLNFRDVQPMIMLSENWL
jgi:hypothetical protein